METTTREQMRVLQSHIADGGFLQSNEWLHFQELLGHRIFHFEADDCFANIIEYTLPPIGKYWYIPRGPVIINQQLTNNNHQTAINRQQTTSNHKPSEAFLHSIVVKAKQEGVGWIRIEPAKESDLSVWEQFPEVSIKKAAHDTQPREILVMPIDGTQEEVLARMKSKTRYNIRLAEKKGVRVFTSHEQEHIDTFCDLVAITAKRDGIVPHPREHYRKMLQAIPDAMLKLYLAEYEGTIVAANLVVFFGTYATYLHGASGNIHREVMAPYLLQWRQIQDAKKNGCEQYDFGGVKTKDAKNTWGGITRFKQGFAPAQDATHFPGSYDVVLASNRYRAYIALQTLKKAYRMVRRIVRNMC